MVEPHYQIVVCENCSQRNRLIAEGRRNFCGRCGYPLEGEEEARRAEVGCATCKYCHDSIDPYTCDICEPNTPQDECLSCHDELAHDVVENQNIHIIGRHTGLDSLEDDPDAYARSWENA